MFAYLLKSDSFQQMNDLGKPNVLVFIIAEISN